MCAAFENVGLSGVGLGGGMSADFIASQIVRWRCIVFSRTEMKAKVVD